MSFIQHVNYPSKLRFKAVIFDLDGVRLILDDVHSFCLKVVTDTADVHKYCWKKLFDDYLQKCNGDGGSKRPFEDDDYFKYVDGKPRYLQTNFAVSE